MINDDFTQFRAKDEPFRVWMANGEVVVSQMIVKPQVKLANGPTIQLQFRIVPSLSCPVILGMPCLINLIHKLIRISLKCMFWFGLLSMYLTTYLIA